MPWGEAPAAKLLAHAHRRGLSVKSSDLPFVKDGTRYPGGSLIFLAEDNQQNLAAQLRNLARRTGAGVTGVADSWVTEGPNFGSRNVVAMPAPRIAIAWDAPTNSYMAGNTRFVICLLYTSDAADE